MHPVRWGIVGTGDVSTSIAPDFSLVGEAHLEAIASRALNTAEQFAALHRIRHAYDDVNLLFNNIDAVYIATPHGTHHEIASRAITAGVHVMVEKPIATTHAQAQQLFELGRSHDRFVMEAMWTKFNPTFAAVIQAVSDGMIGEVRSVRASFGVPFPRGVGSRWSKELGGSTLLDQGIYPVTLATLLLGVPLSLTAQARIVDGVDVSIRADLAHTAGRFSQITASAVEFTELTATVAGTEGWITIDAPFWASRGFTLHRPGTSGLLGDVYQFDIEGAGFAPMIRAASQAILSGQLEAVHHDEAATLATFRTLDLIRASLHSSAAQEQKAEST